MKILIADDHPLIREGLANSLRDIGGNPTILQAENGTEVLTIVAENNDFDVVLLDLFMPATDGFNLLQKLCDQYPDIPIIILSASNDKQHMRKSLDCGASGFIPKSTPHDIMLTAIQLVLSGGVYIPPSLLKQEEDGSTNEQAVIQGSMPENQPNEPVVEGLTQRQREVLKLLGKGQQNKEIARSLGLSQHTVKVHVAAVFRALGVTNRTQAVLAAQNITKSHLAME